MPRATGADRTASPFARRPPHALAFCDWHFTHRVAHRSASRRSGAIGLAAAVADAVGAVLELLERPGDLVRDLVKLAGGHGPGHLQHGVGGVVAGALAELHLDPGRADRLGELGELGGEVVAARLEQRYDFISLQVDLHGGFWARLCGLSARHQDDNAADREIASNPVRLRGRQGDGAHAGSRAGERRRVSEGLNLTLT